MQAKSGRVAKFMPRWDRPYKVLEVYPTSSTYKITLPPPSMQYPTFHLLHLKRHVKNDDAQFLGRQLQKLGPVVSAEGYEEYLIDQILDERPQGRSRQYLIHWQGYGVEADSWVARSELLEMESRVE